MKTFAITLRQNAKYYFRGQEPSEQHRHAGTVVADASLENAAFYIANGMADLYVGPEPRDVEWLDPSHPKSRHARKVKKAKEWNFIIQNCLRAGQ